MCADSTVPTPVEYESHSCSGIPKAGHPRPGVLRGLRSLAELSLLQYKQVPSVQCPDLGGALSQPQRLPVTAQLWGSVSGRHHMHVAEFNT